MSDAYHELLEATIQHLEELKSRRVRFVNVSPRLLAELKGPAAGIAVRNLVSVAAPVPPPVAVPEVRQVVAAPAVKAPAAVTGVVEKTGESGLVPGSSKGGTVARPKLSPEAKAAAFAELRNRAMACVKCAPLAAARKNVVFGVG